MNPYLRLFDKDIRGQLCSRLGCHMEAHMYGICEEHLKQRGMKRSTKKELDESYIDPVNDGDIGTLQADLES